VKAKHLLATATITVLVATTCSSGRRSGNTRELTVRHLNPAGLFHNPAFTQVITVEGPHRVVWVGGQDAVNPEGLVVGKGDLGTQTAQVLANVETALRAAGAELADVVKWTVYVVAGQDMAPAMVIFRRVWGDRPNPPTISVVHVAALAHPDFLLEIEAVAVVAGGC